MDDISYVSFATPQFFRSARKLKVAAARYGMDAYVYTHRHPFIIDLQRRYPDVMSRRRGAGYWLWKPAIILRELQRCPEGAIVLYTDAGVRLMRDPSPLFRLVEEHRAVLFELPREWQRFRQSKWTKRDAFVALAADEPRFWNLHQLECGFIVLQNCAFIRNFISEWLAVCTDPRAITDDPNVLGKPNLEGFVEHRHDQSLLTILAEKHRLPHFACASQYGARCPQPEIGHAADGVWRPASPYGQLFDCHRSRRIPPVAAIESWRFDRRIRLSGDFEFR